MAVLEKIFRGDERRRVRLTEKVRAAG